MVRNERATREILEVGSAKFNFTGDVAGLVRRRRNLAENVKRYFGGPARGKLNFGDGGKFNLKLNHRSKACD